MPDLVTWGYMQPVPEPLLGDEPALQAFIANAVKVWHADATANGLLPDVPSRLCIRDAGEDRIGTTDPATGEYVQGPRYLLQVEGEAPLA